MKAFPNPTLSSASICSAESLNDKDNYGMDLRDYFAIKVAPEIFNTIVKAPDFDPKTDFKTIAKSAYLFADAMLKAREQS